MSISLTACGTITGLPSHGGGKRFAIEQELIASSARKAVKSMNLEALEGRKVGRVARRLFLVGSNLVRYLRAGNFTGGRYSITNLIREKYKNAFTRFKTGSPVAARDYSYPEY